MKVLKTDEDVYQVNKAATHLVSVAAVWASTRVRVSSALMPVDRKCSRSTWLSRASSLSPPSASNARLCSTGTWVRAPACTFGLLVTYGTAASAVARTDNLEFLSDVIPQVVVARQTRETKTARSKKSTTEAGQRKLTELMNPKPARVSPTPEPEAADNEDVVME